MITRQRPKQPLERAVAKALARRAELREQALIRQQAEQAAADAIADAAHASAELDVGHTSATDQSLTVSAEPQQPPRAAGPHDLQPPTDTAATEPDAAAEPEPPTGNGILPPAAMGLIERLANRSLDEPIDEQLEADLSKMQLGLSAADNATPTAKEPAATPDPDILAHVKSLIAETDPDSSTPETSVSTSAASRPEATSTPPPGPQSTPPPSVPDVPDTPETQQRTADASNAPSKAPSGGASFDAFQLLLKSNPEADDNTRSDLRDAPSMRNPRKFLNDNPAPAADAPTDTDRDSAKADPEEQEQERSFRNWFSPKQDPNPPPPPEHDPTRE